LSALIQVLSALPVSVLALVSKSKIDITVYHQSPHLMKSKALVLKLIEGNGNHQYVLPSSIYDGYYLA
jgi:hypothetical protein